VDTQSLIEAAKRALEKSYSPYSHFAVGASLHSKDGRIFTGCNVENASYGLAMCAERVALFKAVSEGATTFDAVCIVADSDIPPYMCGACRQVLYEFSEDGRIKVAYHFRGGTEETELSRLLPRPFVFRRH
jgi:cytidine deaminase